MKKMTAAILLFDLMAGLLFLSLHGLQSRTVASDSRMIMDAEESFDADEVRKIAITFDDEVIIGLSQEICYKEAISMI